VGGRAALGRCGDGGGEAGAQGARWAGAAGLRLDRSRRLRAAEDPAESCGAAPPTCCGTAEAKPEREARWAAAVGLRGRIAAGDSA
jgi:hypothetical protein